MLPQGRSSSSNTGRCIGSPKQHHTQSQPHTHNPSLTHRPTLASCLRSAKGLSKMMHAMDGSLWLCSRAVAAPMDRPHNPIADTRPVVRRCSITYPNKQHEPHKHIPHMQTHTCKQTHTMDILQNQNEKPFRMPALVAHLCIPECSSVQMPHTNTIITNTTTNSNEGSCTYAPRRRRPFHTPPRSRSRHLTCPSQQSPEQTWWHLPPTPPPNCPSTQLGRRSCREGKPHRAAPWRVARCRFQRNVTWGRGGSQ